MSKSGRQMKTDDTVTEGRNRKKKYLNRLIHLKKKMIIRGKRQRQYLKASIAKIP